MPKDVVMPALGMAQETGTLLQWLKASGDSITKGEPLMEIETDKTTVEYEAPASGVLANVTAHPGDVIPVGQVIAMILLPGESVPPSDPAPAKPTPLARRIAAEHNVDLAQVQSPSKSGRVQKDDVLAYVESQSQRQSPISNGTFQPSPSLPAASSGVSPASSLPASVKDSSVSTTTVIDAPFVNPSVSVRSLSSPKARRLAQERSLNLSAISGSGPGGAVLAADVLAVPSAPVPASPEPQTATTSRMWRIMAERVTQAWTTIPHFYLLREVNATRLIAWLAEARARSPEKITYTDLLVKVTAAALRQHPRLNASWQNNAIALNPEVNIGLAVAVEDGLLVPVVHRADTLGLSQLAARRIELVARAQAGKLAPDDLSGGTFTISNLGMYGVDAFNAIVNLPQVAILAVGQIADRVVPLNGQPAVQPMITLSLSCDHRVVDGARGAQFLQTLASLIEDPMRLLD